MNQQIIQVVLGKFDKARVFSFLPMDMAHGKYGMFFNLWKKMVAFTPQAIL